MIKKLLFYRYRYGFKCADESLVLDDRIFKLKTPMQQKYAIFGNISTSLLNLAFMLFIIGQSSWAQTYIYEHAIDDPLGKQKSHVYNVYDNYAVRGITVDRNQLKLMLNTGIREISGQKDISKAWRTYIHDQDKVAINFTRVVGQNLGIDKEIAAAMLEIFEEIGFKKSQFMLVGLIELPEKELVAETIKWEYGWQETLVDFQSGKDQLAKWLKEVTAIINVPTMMDHNVYQLHGAMGNLTWAMLKHPGRLYINQGDPFIPEIYELPQIRGKVRLHIANCLQVPYYGGPEIMGKYLYEKGSLLFSTDPVALDRVGLELIRLYRRTEDMPDDVTDALFAEYLITAQTMGLGYYDLNYIDYHDKIRIDKHLIK